MEGVIDSPDAEKRRPRRPGTITAVFLVALPLLLVVFLFRDIAADALLWPELKQQSTHLLIPKLTHAGCTLRARYSMRSLIRLPDQ